ncbi:MAG: ABC transporter permease [Candidatus Nanosalina sp.]
MNLRKYYAVARNAFKQATAYRLDAVTTLLSSVVFLVLYYAVWTAIDASGSVEGGLNQVMTYLVAGQVVSNAAFLQTEQFVGYRVRKGTIVNELKRPISFISHVYFHELGWVVFNTLVKALPIALVGAVFLNVKMPNLLNTAYFAVSTFLAFNLVFLLAYANSMFVFWTKVDWSIRMMRNTVTRLFSGVLFPLYLLPGGLEKIFNLLPFRAMADAPIQIFTGQASGSQILKIFGLQIFWIGIMFVIAHLMWRKAKTKLTVQGG